MSESLTAADREMLQAGHFATLTTVMADGSPQSTVTWVDADDTHILVNTAMGRLKTRNAQRDPRVAVLVTDRDDGYRFISVRGRVVEFVTEGADEHIDLLAKRYAGDDVFPGHTPDRQRVILRIEPDKIMRRST